VLEVGIEKTIGLMRDLFVMIETGQLTAETAGREFNKVFTELGAAMVEANEIAGPEFLELIDLAKRFGIEMGAVTDFILERTGVVGSGLASMFQPLIDSAGASTSAIAEYEETIESLSAELETAEDRLGKAARGTSEYARAQLEVNEISGQLAEVQHQLNAEMDRLSETTAASKEELEDLGIIALGAFQAAVEGGASMLEAVNAIGPGLDQLIEAEKALGVEVENTAVQELQRFRELVKGNESLVAATEALDDTLVALSHTGSLNTETLAAMERQGMRTFDRLIEAGFNQQQALSMMVPFIEKVMEAHDRLGIPIDDNTQALIDQANQSGLLGNKTESAMEQAAAALSEVAASIRELVDGLIGASKATAGFDRQIDRLPSRVDIQVGWDVKSLKLPNIPGLQIPGFQHGTGGKFINFGSGTLAMLHGRERIIPASGDRGRGGFGGSVSSGHDDEVHQEIVGLRSDMERLPDVLSIALQAALQKSRV
jgi:hypothetical protein